MTDLKRIEELLDKYYRGETSTGEEDSLREFFSGQDIPSHLEAEAGLFRYFVQQREDTFPGEMEERLGGMIADSDPGEMEKRLKEMVPVSGTREIEGRQKYLVPGSETRKIGGGIKLRYYLISSAAAVILILMGIFVDMQIRRNSMLEVRQDTFEDPYLAYAEAKKVLYLVSEKMNAGRKPLKNIKKLEAGVNYMHPVFSFGAGIQHLEHLNTIEKTRKLLSD